jgi:hypothetical protein
MFGSDFHPARSLFRGLVCSAALFVAAVPAARAQAPLPATGGAVSFDARAFKDSLDRITDRRTIRDIEMAGEKAHSAASLVASGFAALRSFELSRLSDDAKKARRHFENARDLDETDPWPLYGWALAVLTQVKPDHDTGRFGFAGDDRFMEDLGLDPRSRARRALQKAVTIDASFPEAAQLLAQLAIDTRDRTASTQATAALEKLAESRPDDAASRLALAAAANAAGDLEKAASAAKAAAALSTGAEASAAHHQAARALLRMDGRADEGAREYFEGLRNLTRAEAAHYYDELRGIATKSEMAELETLPLVRAQSWIHTFWEMHAALSAVTVPHRLASHYARLPHAEKFFMRRMQYGAPSSNALLLQRPESPFDDRGFVYLRHGEPDDIISTPSTQSWVYLNEGGRPVMYHFTDGQSEGIKGFGDWYLMYNLPCDMDFMAARSVYDKRLATLIYRCDALSVRDVSSRVRRDVMEGLRTDVDNIGFVQPLSATYDIYSFRGDRNWTDLVATVGVQAARMRPQVLANGDRLYAVKASLIVVDTATRSVARRDTVIEARAVEAANRGSIVLGDLKLTAYPATGMVHRVVVADAYVPTRGQLYGGPLKVADYSGGSLMMSDIVLAAPDMEGSFKRGAVSLTLVPWQAFPQGSFRIFYELYNVSPGHPYTTELKVESVSKGITGAVGGIFGRKPAVSLRFDDVAPANGTLIQQVRDARADLSPGEYRLTVTITDQRTGQKISRVRPVTIFK